jgi:hypothetical protein
MLNVPEDCVKYKHPAFDEIINNSDKFITKICRDSFAGYAVAQIKKARGLNKKIVNPVAKEKKSPLDFCHVISGYSTKALEKFLSENGYEQRFCGVAAVANAKDTFVLFYDQDAHNCFSESIPEKSREELKAARKSAGLPMGFGYKGILLEIEGGDGFASNEIRMSSIPKGQEQIATFNYNKDGYTKYCKDYREYWHWVENRNDARYNDNANHGKGYDGKNLMHCKRLLSMALEVAEGKGINVRRKDREHLLSIRRGEYDYDVLIQEAESLIKEIDVKFETSNLPDKVDKEFSNNLLIKIRKSFYGLQ